jgi:hypothetical protein
MTNISDIMQLKKTEISIALPVFSSINTFNDLNMQDSISPQKPIIRIMIDQEKYESVHASQFF